MKRSSFWLLFVTLPLGLLAIVTAVVSNAVMGDQSKWFVMTALLLFVAQMVTLGIGIRAKNRELREGL